MKAIFSLAVLGLAVAWSSSVFAENETDKMLAEMKKCDVCKNLIENPELLMSMDWETHKTENGMLSLSTVPKKKKKDFDKVNGKMRHAIEQVTADVKAGKE